MTLAIIDSLAAYAWARDAGYETIVTDNPVLARDPATEGRVLNGDAAISQDEANRFGRQTITLANRIDDGLRQSGLLEQLGLPAHVQLAGASSRVLASLVYRGLVAARARATHTPEAIGIGATNQPLTGPDGIALSRLHQPVATLAEAGFFGDVAVTQMRFPEPPSRHHADVPTDPLRRFMHVPLSFLMLEGLRRLGLPRGTRDVFVLGENEALREALPYLAASGCRLRRLGKAKLPKITDLPAVSLTAPVAQEIADGIAGLQLFTPTEAAVLAGTVRAWCEQTLARLAADWPALQQQMTKALGSPGAVVLTNGLFGPRGTLTYAALKAAGATVVDIEHGVTTGLSAHSQAKIDFSEAATSDVVLCCSDVAAKAFRQAQAAPARRIEAIGLADQTRHLFRPRLQRHVARKALGLDARETVIFHASTLTYQGNLRPGYGTPTETFVEELERRLVEETYAALPHRVIYKPYPTERLAHLPPLETRLALPANVSICPPEDLRYFRAAADVMVTGVPTSTLGWVLGAGVPVVWLASRTVFPLLDEALESDIESAFLTVDIDRAGWPERLTALLSRPLANIAAEWDKKRAAREAFCARAITGPQGSCGRRAARIVRSIMKDGLRP